MFKRSLFRLLVLCLLAVAAVLVFRDQQTRLQPEEIAVSDPRIPAAFQGFRIAQISDLHGAQFGPDNERLLDCVAQQRPDLIALTGDLIDEYTDWAMLPPLLDGLTAIAPTYYVTGNHEWATRRTGELKALLADHGVTVLSNQYVTLEREGQTIALAGIDDPNGPADQKTPEQLMGELREELGDLYVILLAHRNDRYETYAACGADLTLTGHAHGGLIRLPFTDGLISTRRTLFPSHTAGLYPLDYGTLMVSRGLGNIHHTFRLFNRPHLPILVLNPAGAA